MCSVQKTRHYDKIEKEKHDGKEGEEEETDNSPSFRVERDESGMSGGGVDDDADGAVAQTSGDAAALGVAKVNVTGQPVDRYVAGVF